MDAIGRIASNIENIRTKSAEDSEVNFENEENDRFSLKISPTKQKRKILSNLDIYSA